MKLPNGIERILVDVFELDIEKVVSDLQTENKDCSARTLKLQKVLEDANRLLEVANQKNINLNKSNVWLEEQIVQMKEKGFAEVHPEEAHWNGKHPHANIKYTARKHPITNQPMGIDVKLHVQPNDYEIHSWLKSKKLVIENPMELDVIAPKIYYEHQRSWFDYGSDKQNFGQSEFWAFPWELRAARQTNRKADCDDFANSIVSSLRAAGVPSWRVRNVCGMTNGLPFGHSTVYVLDDSLQTWRHLNSTSMNRYMKLTDAPDARDTNDKIGIDPEQIWFSFNDEHAWHKFDTSASKQSFEGNAWRKNFRIEPIGR